MARLVPLALIVFVLIAGCDDESSPSASSPSREGRTVDDLPHGAFGALALSEDGEPRPIVPKTEIVVSFEKVGRIGWDSGCNNGSSDLEITGDRLKVDDRFATTLKGCPGPLGGQERWLIGLLTSDPEWRLDGRRLTLNSGARGMELESLAEA
jgi:heat shock protein HslJ